MTYCIGVMLDQGMIFASDSRTNAGVDDIGKFCKMTVFERRGDRVIVLLSSGATCHVAHLAIQRGNRPRFLGWMVATIVLGFGFEIGQAYEFIEKLAPSWIGADPSQAMAFNANAFASAFFTMTGFHGLHVLGGLVILCILLWRFQKGQFSARHHVGIAAGAIYWHFVDVVWVFLFAVLYLAVTYRGLGG